LSFIKVVINIIKRTQSINSSKNVTMDNSQETKIKYNLIYIGSSETIRCAP